MDVIKAWVKLDRNSVLNGDGFYISYNPSTGDTAMGSLLTDFGNIMGGELEDGEETALVKDGVFSILSGDWRNDYEKLVDKGYDACYKFFKTKQKKYGNNWSTNEEDR